MKKVAAILMIVGFIISCNSTQKTTTDSNKVSTKTSDTVRIANDEIEYEVIIIDPGFNSFLYGQARPRGYYSESFLEQRNRIYVMEWNSRVLQPSRYDSNLYEMQIDYDWNIHYGYEVNYLIYNYFIYFQIRYKQQLAGFVPRI
jgi:Family of unknown function (DUF6146)